MIVERAPLFLLLCGALAATPAMAADYPNRAITVVIPFAPGGLVDNVARPLADALSRELHQPVVIENKGGAGGVVGTGAVARSKPDGYTLLLTLSSISVLPEADKLLGRKPAFQLDQFTPIARITADPNLLVVRADAPWRTAKELVEDSKRNPHSYNYGTSGVYGAMHVPIEMLKHDSDAKITHVPFSGGGPAMNALLAGQIQVAASGAPNAGQFIKAGKLRALAHWGDKPLSSFPDVPSLKSLGYDVNFVQWTALMTPAGTPQAVVKRLRDAVRTVTQDPKLQETFVRLGSPIDYMDAPEFGPYWKADAARLVAAVQKIGKVD